MNRRIWVLAVLIGLAGAASVMAGTFTVTLTNGTTFESRYRPAEADWDENVVLLATDRGNRIALLKEEIADVTSSVEESGFGYQVDTTTLFIGWSPKLGDEEGEDGEGGEGGDTQSQQNFDAPQPSFSLQQFVNPGQTGPSELPAYTGYGPQGQ